MNTIMSKHRKSVEIKKKKKCCYGCGNLVRFLSPNGKTMCDSSANKCPILKKKNSDSIKIAHEQGRVFGWNKLYETHNLNRSWSKGLTKETDKRILKQSESKRESIISGTYVPHRTPHTFESKEKLSISRIKYLENSPNIKWYSLSTGIKVQGLWELNVGEKLLLEGFSLTRTFLKYNNHHRYTPDFCIGENIYVEVKGWLSDRDKEKYKKVLSEHQDIKIFLIRDELGIGNYTKFISGEIHLEECEDLRKVLGC